MEQKIDIRLGREEDLEAVASVMEQVKNGMTQADWFVADSPDYLRTHLDGTDGFVIVAERSSVGRPEAFFMVDFPGDSPKNLAADLGFSRNEWGLAAHMDSAAVLPGLRGRGLMSAMLVKAEEELSRRGFCHLLATVHPDNPYSLNNMLRNGYEIGATMEKYGGLKRHILYKRLHHKRQPVILVSACLLGVSCRYNGKGELNEALRELMDHALLVPVCPEILGGLATPRDPAERLGGRVVTICGCDVTAAYEKGAKETLKLARLYGSRCAILKERSPSCGSGRIYDGTHTRTLKDGDGVSAALLKEAGIRVFGESGIQAAKDFIEENQNVCYNAV